MKKTTVLIISVFMLFSIVGCSKKQENEVIEQGEITEPLNEDITFTSGLNITNNNVYDGSKREYVYNHLVGNYGGLEIYDEGNRTFSINFDGGINIKAIVKNVSNEPLGFSMKDPTISGEIIKYDAAGPGAILHPNGAANYMLEPGEEKTIQVDNSLLRGSINEDMSASYIFNIPFGVIDSKGNYSEYPLVFEETVTYLTRETLMTNKYLNAIVEGRIIDKDGNPISDAEVEVKCPIIEGNNRVRTNNNGEYSVTVVAATSSMTNAWREAALVVNKEGYNQRYIPVYPKSNQTVTAEVTLYEKKYEYIYEDVTTLDVGLEAYEYETNQIDTISFVPFHTGYDSKQVADKIKLTTTDFDGNVLYEYSMPNEIPFVDLSKDGQYTVVSKNYNDNGGFEIVILDKSGKEVYKTHDLKAVDKKYAPDQNSINTGISRCWQLSNDNKYLVASDANGNIWFIDWQNDNVLWSDYQFGQVRNIKFDKDSDVFYLNTGGGNLYCYDFNGNIKWETDTLTWSPKMEVTSKYIVMTLKCGGTNLLVFDKTNGNLVWSYDTMQGNMGLAISPDEKYLWYGAHSSSSYSVIGSSIFVLDTGELVGMLNNFNCRGGQFSKDGSKIVVRGYGDISVYDGKNGALLWTKNYCEGDYTGNFAAAINEDGSKIAVALNDQNDMNYGYIHYCALKEIKDYISNSQSQSNPEPNNNTPPNENNNVGDQEPLNVNETNIKNSTYTVYIESDEYIRLYLDKDRKVLEFAGPDNSGNMFTNGLARKDIYGKDIKDVIVDVLDVGTELGLINESSHLKVELEEVNIDSESTFKNVLKDVDKQIKTYKKDKDINFTYSVNDENYHVKQ